MYISYEFIEECNAYMYCVFDEKGYAWAFKTTYLEALEKLNEMEHNLNYL